MKSSGIPEKSRINIYRSVLAVLLTAAMLISLCACSLDFSTTETEGQFSYACGKKKAFVYEYIWDGTEEGLTVEIPETYGKLKVVSVGGYFGRGLPMPFSVDVSEALSKQGGKYYEKPSDESEALSPEETVYLVFTLRIGPEIEDIHLYGEDRFLWEDGGVVNEYIVRALIDRE